MAAFAMTSFAQQTQQYFRVEFTVPMTGEKVPAGQSNNSVASTMKDDFIYCNPDNDYLDFQAGGNIITRGTNGGGGKTGTAMPMSFRSTTTSYSATSAFYLDNKRTGQYNETTQQYNLATYKFDVDKIKRITAYSIPVEKVELIDSVPFTDYKFPGNGKTYRGSLFTFNRLPRNVAELKTLMEDANGKRVEAGKNPLFVAAVFYLVCPRLLDCSQDCRDMMDYLFGVHYDQLSTHGIANQTFQNWCIGSSFDQKVNGFRTHNVIFQHFAGAKPSNQYKPNGKGYGYDNGPYTVRIVWDNATPTEHSGLKNATIARLLTMPNPDATEKADMSFDDPTAHLVKLIQYGQHWFMMDGEKIYMQKGKDQTTDYSDFEF